MRTEIFSGVSDLNTMLRRHWVEQERSWPSASLDEMGEQLELSLLFVLNHTSLTFGGVAPIPA
jgi:hypothetical protein